MFFFVFFLLTYSQNIYCGYIALVTWFPQIATYWYMFFRVSNKIFLNISSYLSHLWQRVSSTEIVVVMGFVLISNVAKEGWLLSNKADVFVFYDLLRKISILIRMKSICPVWQATGVATEKKHQTTHKQNLASMQEFCYSVHADSTTMANLSPMLNDLQC